LSLRKDFFFFSYFEQLFDELFDDLLSEPFALLELVTEALLPEEELLEAVPFPFYCNSLASTATSSPATCSPSLAVKET
jgi:hypothetical protein